MMSNEIVEVLNTETGERGAIRRKLFDNPVINNGILIEVDARQKPYVSELYKSKVALGVDDPSPEDTVEKFTDTENPDEKDEDE